MSVSQPETGVTSLPDFSSMTEEEQIAYAMQMSLAGGGLLALRIHILKLNDPRYLQGWTWWSSVNGRDGHVLKIYSLTRQLYLFV